MSSKCFHSSPWIERLVPVLLVLLTIGLLATLIIVGLSVLGATPGR